MASRSPHMEGSQRERERERGGGGGEGERQRKREREGGSLATEATVNSIHIHRAQNLQVDHYSLHFPNVLKMTV